MPGGKCLTEIWFFNPEVPLFNEGVFGILEKVPWPNKWSSVSADRGKNSGLNNFRYIHKILTWL